jgi:hypothetical protein
VVEESIDSFAVGKILLRHQYPLKLVVSTEVGRLPSSILGQRIWRQYVPPKRLFRSTQPLAFTCRIIPWAVCSATSEPGTCVTRRATAVSQGILPLQPSQHPRGAVKTQESYPSPPLPLFYDPRSDPKLSYSCREERNICMATGDTRKFPWARKHHGFMHRVQATNSQSRIRGFITNRRFGGTCRLHLRSRRNT